MIASIHQLNYMPWIGFFNKVKQSDILVMLDNADYVIQKFQNRNKIKTLKGWMYITIPIERKYHGKPFNNVMLPKNDKWKQEHWLSIQRNYAKAPYFKDYSVFFERLYKKNIKTLMKLNEEIIRYLLKQFSIKTKIVKTSELKIDKKFKKTDLLIEVLKKIKADTYLSGKTGKEYLEEEKFKKNNIKLIYQDFEHPVYKQKFEGFIPNMATIDLLFNMGAKSTELI